MSIQPSQQTVLVVDDSPESLDIIHQALDDAGYNVLVALNGSQALKIAEQFKPDVVLLDAVMPIMGGFECCEKLRIELPLTPIIFMTGLTDTEDIVKGFNAGGNDYIIKPIHPSELLARIEAHSKSAQFTKEARTALDDVRQYIFCTSKAGVIIWSTPESENLLNTLQSVHPSLKQSITQWLATQSLENDLSLPMGEKTISISHFKTLNEQEYLLKLSDPSHFFKSETLESLLDITKRESDVLLWLAHGKSNKDIASILDMSPRTVNKHLEQVYLKLQVDNRTAATLIAIKALYGIK